MERRERTAQLLRAALEVSSRQGFHGMSMREVAREAQVGIATLYRHFANIEDLIYRVHQQVLTTAIASAEASLAGRGRKERLKSLVTDHIRRIVAHPAEVAVHGGEPPPLREPNAGRIEALREHYRALVREAASLFLGGFKSRQDADRHVSLLLAMAERQALEATWQGPRPIRKSKASAPSTPRVRADRLAAPVLQLFAAGAPRRKRTPRKRST